MPHGQRNRAADGGEDTHAPTHGAGSSAVVPKIVGVLVALMVVRVLLKVGKRTAGSTEWRERRHEAIAKLHRELHAADAPDPA